MKIIKTIYEQLWITQNVKKHVYTLIADYIRSNAKRIQFKLYYVFQLS